MPNWCNNSAEITGPADIIKELFEGWKGAGLFQTVMPDGGYGTKWDVNEEHGSSELEYEEEDGEATLYGWFDTAWTPPLDFYDVLTQKEISVTAGWYESGYKKAGVYNGGVRDEFDVPDDIEERKEQLPESLDERFGLYEDYD